jgi:hypothetical protein
MRIATILRRRDRRYQRARQSRPAPGKCTDWTNNPKRAEADAKLDAELAAWRAAHPAG